LMKKFTIITLPEHSTTVLESIGKARIAHLIEVTGPDFERFKEVAEEVDFGELKDNAEKELEEAEKEIEEARARLAEFMLRRLTYLRALEPEELKRCLVVGVVELTLLPRLEEHLKRLGDATYRVVEISPDEGFLFVFGPEERRRWVETIFLVFDVKDIFDVLSVGDILLVLDLEIREETIKEYEEEIEKNKEDIEKRQRRIESYLEPRVRLLETLRGVPVLSTDMISVIQGWVPTEKLPEFKETISGVEEVIGERLIVQYEDPTHGEEVPTMRPTIRPKFLDPAFTLTSLRGWPTAHEVDPSIVTILVFSLQFGLMFGDVGQGIIFLILGLILSRMFKRGMASKIAVMFVPMGIFAIFFGFLFGEVFLVEGLIHPLLLSPLHDIGKLMKMVLGIAVLEMSIGLVIGAINEYKGGNIWGALGEHGVGAILFLVGLYTGALYFLEVGDFMAIMSHWSFMLMIGGLVMAMVSPMLTAVFVHKHFGFEAFGEGVGALLMTFVECLANFFSFLRIAAFALAHASLAVAAHSMVGFMGVGGIVLMNVIAMTFEFISSCVQSLRLLYYEFMGKFFHGTGTPFKSFRVRK
jgi:vacuolar-type H+-ATPase subunit I/STV1